ncbi:MAG: DUF1559 domain-containing protein [Planctomycetaceae bacterium]|nr:DUF1559 domain-containing protein [Planctomycetaceae bacterium]
MRVIRIIDTVLAALVAAVVISLVAVQRGHIEESARTNGLGALAGAAKAYNSKYGSLPPSIIENAERQHEHSWRALLFVDLWPSHAEIYGYRYNESWDSPFNSSLHHKGSPSGMYHCPSDPAPENQTSYVAVVGSDTLFPEQASRKLEEIPGVTVHRMAQDNVNYSGAGLSNTILFAEMHKSGIHWAEPRDISIDDALKGVNKTTPSISGDHSFTFGFRKGPMVVFADGHVEFLNPNIDPKVLRSLLEVKNPDKPKE